MYQASKNYIKDCKKVVNINNLNDCKIVVNINHFSVVEPDENVIYEFNVKLI